MTMLTTVRLILIMTLLDMCFIPAGKHIFRSFSIIWGISGCTFYVFVPPTIMTIPQSDKLLPVSKKRYLRVPHK
jgi:hypothetical protein